MATQSVRMNFKPGKRSSWSVCHSRRCGLADRASHGIFDNLIAEIIDNARDRENIAQPLIEGLRLGGRVTLSLCGRYRSLRTPKMCALAFELNDLSYRPLLKT